MLAEINDNLRINPLQITSAKYFKGNWTIKTTSGEGFKLSNEEFQSLECYTDNIALFFEYFVAKLDSTND